MPVVPSRRMRIEAERRAEVLDALGSASLADCLHHSKERPRVGMVGVDPQRRRQFSCAYLRLTIMKQDVAEIRMRASVLRIERNSALSRRKRKPSMGFLAFSPI